MERHSVVVGNIGQVYEGTSAQEAQRNFTEYKEQSENGYGRASGEDVTWYKNGDIEKEHTGRINRENAVEQIERWDDCA